MTEMVQPSVPEIYVSFSAEISLPTSEALIQTMSNIANQRIPKVTLLLSTPGGSVQAGMNIYNILQGMPFELTVHNVGNTDSIGNAIFQAGKIRVASPHATFMFHGVAIGSAAGENLAEKTLFERLDTLRSDQKRIDNLLAERTSLTTDQLQQFSLDAKTLNAQEALTAGILDKIEPVRIPIGIQVIAHAFNR